MAKTVSELAKELGLSSHDVLEVCADEGIDATGHASELTSEQEGLIVDLLLAQSEKKSKKTVKKKTAKKKKVVKKKAEPAPAPPEEEKPKKVVKKVKKIVKRVIKKRHETPAAATGEAVAETPAEAPATPVAGQTTEAPAPPKKKIKKPEKREETIIGGVRAAEKDKQGKLVEKLIASGRHKPASEAAPSGPRKPSGDDDDQSAFRVRARGTSSKVQTPRKIVRKVFKEGAEMGAATAPAGKPMAPPPRLKRSQRKVFRPTGRRRSVTPVVRKTEAEVHVPATVKDLAAALGVRASDLIRFCMDNGVAVTMNSVVPEEQIELAGIQFGVEVKLVRKAGLEDRLSQEVSVEDKPEELAFRSPVVTFLGHVDHGKTSLLDAIRHSSVVSGEAGGITQHIGAYRVKTESGHYVTFLDTPGHAAFTAMRARGANITDVVVLVVAADDGIMPQTEEAISHAKAAGVPVIVAVNKMDLPGANLERVKQQLTQHELIPEEWGGETQVVPVSAVTKQGIDDLLERLVLESELLELKANPNRSAQGRVVEASVDPQRGVEVTLLVQNGTLKRGDTVIAGNATGRVRSLTGDRGQPIESAGPSAPARVAGFAEAPQAGDEFYAVEDMAMAKQLAGERRQKQHVAGLTKRPAVSLESLFERIGEGEMRELLIVLKADVQGSLEVLDKTLVDLSTDEVKVRILHKGLGPVSESDVLLAEASDGLVVGFHVLAPEPIRKLANDKSVEIKLYNIIYQLVEDIRAALAGMHKPIEQEVVDGHAEVRQTFKVSRKGTIAGCYVTDGTIERNNPVRIFREGRLIHEGKLVSLKRFKDDVRSVKNDFECGMQIAGYDDVKEGDVIESFHIVQVAQTV